MDRSRSGLARGLGSGLVAVAVVAASVMVGSDDAEARFRRQRSTGGDYQPPYAAIVVDANSGQTLHAANSDSPRHPASLTKIMTLYLLFEQIEAGKLRLDSRLPVSAHAAVQPPTKLGLAAGSTLAVEDAIKGMVTKSANDAAVVVAEAIGGSEEDFARWMTRKARALGMSRTTYVNASGLPDDEQITSARDQAVLGRAIQERFPRYYGYFATPSFSYRGVAMRNHNRLLGRVAGVDGIKTGYTRSSGFNLVSSVRRGNRHIVAVVLGGSSGGARDARMRELIEANIDEAATRRTAAVIAEAPDQARARPRTEPTRIAASAPLAMAPAPAPLPPPAASAATPPAASPPPAADPNPQPRFADVMMPSPSSLTTPPPGSSEPIRPVPVRTVSVRPGAIQVAAIAPLATPAPQAAVAPPQLAAAASQPVALPPPPGARPGILGVLPVRAGAAPPPEMAAAATPPSPHGTATHGEWTIQVGAFPDEDQAKERLKTAKSMARSLLGNADPFTERVVKGSRELYRARFVGLDRDGAEAACHYFKKNEIACLALKN
jgi:D-alanyl-D-alanine carboxypeptidase